MNSVVGGVIKDYGGDPSWQADVLLELRRDRVGVITEASGDGIFHNAVDASLKLCSPFATQVFLSLGTAPEDVWITYATAKLICGSDPDVTAAGKVATLPLRRAVKVLLDRNLL